MVVIGILGLLVGILAVAVIPRLTEAKNKLEVKQVGDLMAGFQGIAADDSKRGKLGKKGVAEAKGEKLYEALFKKRLLDDALLSKIVSLNTKTDNKADKAWIEEEGGTMPANSVSYTAPKGDDLMKVMSLKGKGRKIVLTFNSRNWLNYEDQGAIVQWSDGETAQYMNKEEATDEHNLDAETWTNSPSEIIGEKAPFDRTFE